MSFFLSRFVRQWWCQTSPEQLLQSQTKLVSALVLSNNNHHDNSIQVVSLPNTTSSSSGLNAIEFTATTSSRDTNLPTVVLAHGFGSGLGFFIPNVHALLQSGQVGKVILVDWLGMGGSHRPPCRRPIRSWLSPECTGSFCNSRFSPSQAVNFFIDPFHEWMKQHVFVSTNDNNNNNNNNNKNPIWLVGHSLGGYLAARYALKYYCDQGGSSSSSSTNGRLEKLVLASPVGFPSKPPNTLKGSQLPTSLRLIDTMWNANITPQQLVRMMGRTRGKNAVQRALQGRIPHLESYMVELLSEYLYHITVAHPSGEFAMNSLLEPGISPDVMGVYSREPLEVMLNNIGNNLPIQVLFGDSDWMRPNGESTARRILGDDKVSIVKAAGHHLYLDNPTDFVKHILS